MTQEKKKLKFRVKEGEVKIKARGLSSPFLFTMNIITIRIADLLPLNI
jgi:hypothetical protein